MTATKTCSKCGREQPLQEFYFMPSALDKLDSWCRGCRKADRASRDEKYRKDHATWDEVCIYVEGLNLGYRLPRRGGNSGGGSGASKKIKALVDRYNREHPERPYVPPADR